MMAPRNKNEISRKVQWYLYKRGYHEKNGWQWIDIKEILLSEHIYIAHNRIIIPIRTERRRWE